MDSIGERNYTYIGNSFKSKWLSDIDETFVDRLEKPRIIINDSLSLLSNYLFDINFILKFAVRNPIFSKLENGNTAIIYKSISNETLIPLSKFFENFGGVNLVYCKIALNNKAQIVSNIFCFKQKSKNILVEQIFDYQSSLPSKVVTLTKKGDVVTNEVIQSFKYTTFH